jgi:hypothetical protein
MLKNSLPLEVVQKIMDDIITTTTQMCANVLQGGAQKDMEKLKFI